MQMRQRNSSAGIIVLSYSVQNGEIMKKYIPYKNRVELSKRTNLSHKKIKDMRPDELLDSIKLVEVEMKTRGLGMLFG